MNRQALLVALSLQLLVSSCNEPSERSTIALDSGWEFRQVPRDAWRHASVPGCVHTDLLAAGLIDDPFFGTNEHHLQWIENKDWEYRVIFDMPPAFIARKHIEIDFEGLDTYADVYLNDALLFKADNMFREWKAPCAGVLREKGNELRVYFHSAVSAVRAGWDSLGRELPGGARVLARKAAYQYGWDWAPRFVTSGVWRPVRLHAWDEARIADFRIVQKRLTRESAELTAVFEIEASSRIDVALSVFREDRIVASVDAELVPGPNAVSIDFTVPEPELWWPNGLGEPRLYEFLGEMRDGAFVVDRAARRVGLRTIELVRDRDEKGESFSFRVNGLPVFMKGANFVPMDSFIPRVEAERYEWLVASAAGANMNMLRVWGGGAYESELFYDLCDEYGILVWQDFMFACAMYPGDSAFLANVREEAVGVVKRLRNHPCLALWCGNNEIDEGWHNWGWQRQYGYSAADSAKIWSDYVKLFHELLPGVVAELDSGAAYWPSSPGRGRADPRSLTEGDSHYWGVWHDGEAFEAFREKVPRFMSEFGFQSFPSLATIARFADPEDWRIDSAAMLAHQKHPRGNEIIREYMERSYRAPRDFESFVYVSQLLQAEGMKTAIEAQRRAKPSCMGSLYWQLDDCWPAPSWSSIDYEGDPKALHYFARDAFGEALVSPVVEDGVLRVYAVSDRAAAIEGVAMLKVLDFSGNVIWTDSRRVTVGPDSSVSFFESDVESLLRGRARGAAVFSAELWEADALLSRNLLYFAPPRELDLPPIETARSGERKSGSNLSVRSISRFEHGYAISLCARALVKNLYLSVEGHEGFFDRNFFDMLPGSCETVLFVTDEDIGDFDAALVIDVPRGHVLKEGATDAKNRHRAVPRLRMRSGRVLDREEARVHELRRPVHRDVGARAHLSGGHGALRRRAAQPRYEAHGVGRMLRVPLFRQRRVRIQPHAPERHGSLRLRGHSPHADGRRRAARPRRRRRIPKRGTARDSAIRMRRPRRVTTASSSTTGASRSSSPRRSARASTGTPFRRARARTSLSTSPIATRSSNRTPRSRATTKSSASEDRGIGPTISMCTSRRSSRNRSARRASRSTIRS